MTDVLLGIEYLLIDSSVAIVLIWLTFNIGKRLVAPSLTADLSLPHRSRRVVVMIGVACLIGALCTGVPVFRAHLNAMELVSRLLAEARIALWTVTALVVYQNLHLGRWVDALVQDPPGTMSESTPRAQWTWLLAGLAAISLVLVWLEFRQPFYFTQDDNLAQNLPEIVYACRNMFSGVFPTWNPYQHMGSPNTTLGWYALTYPPTYFSYWFAKSLLHNEYALLEVFAFLHLLAAYFVIYWVIRREGCRPSLAMLGSSCCVLSGYALIYSRSWFQFSAVLLWMPLLIACVQSLKNGSSGWKWILAYGLAIGCAFHSGHIQMWIYTVMFADLAIVLLMCTGGVPWRAIWSTTAAHFWALAIASPLLVPEWMATFDVLRRHPDSNGILPGLVSFFVPATVIATHWPGIGQHKYMGEMYYSGTVFIVLIGFLLFSVVASRWTRIDFRHNVWFLCAATAFWLALGDDGLLWTGMMHLPGFWRFRFPFKLVAYVVMFSALAGAVALERVLRLLRYQFKIELMLAVVLGVVLVYHSSICMDAFYRYNFQPYPKVAPKLLSLLRPSDGKTYPKVLPLSGVHPPFGEQGLRSTDPAFIDSMMNQWPTLNGIFSIEGYNGQASESPLFQRVVLRVNNNTQRALYEYGVEYVLEYYPPGWTKSPQMKGLEAMPIVYETDRIKLRELPRPRPMAFSEDDPEVSLPVEFDGSGAKIETTQVSQGGKVVLNLMWRPEYAANEGDSVLSVVPDRWGRVEIEVPPHTKTIRVAFRPGWRYGFLLAVIAAMVGALTSASYVRWDKRTRLNATSAAAAS